MPLKNFIVTGTLTVNNHMALGTTFKIEDSNNFNHQELVALLVNKNLKIQIGENFLNTSVTSIDYYLSNNDHSLVNVFMVTTLPSNTEIPIGSNITVL